MLGMNCTRADCSVHQWIVLGALLEVFGAGPSGALRPCLYMAWGPHVNSINLHLHKSENRCRHCSLFRVSFSVLSFKNYYFSPLKGSTHWCLCWTISIYFKQSISFLLSKEIQFALFSATLYAMWPLQCNSLGEFHLILQTGETLPDSGLLLQMIYVYS